MPALAAAASTTPPTSTSTSASTPSQAEQEEKRRTFVVRTPDSRSPLKVAVPSTTAEAMAMNTSIKKKAKRDAERAAAAAAAAAAPRPPIKFPPSGRTPAAAAATATGAASSVGRRDSPGGKKPAGKGAVTAGGGQQRAPSLMVVTPNARSKAIQMKVPRTTAECIELNKAIRERYPGEARQETDGSNGTVNNKINANYAMRWRNPPAPAPGGGGGGVRGSGVRLGQAGRSRDARGAAAGTVLSSSEMFGFTQPGHGSGDPSIERTIGNLYNGMRWEQIVRVWEVRGRTKDMRAIWYSAHPVCYYEPVHICRFAYGLLCFCTLLAEVNAAIFVVHAYVCGRKAS